MKQLSVVERLMLLFHLQTMDWKHSSSIIFSLYSSVSSSKGDAGCLRGFRDYSQNPADDPGMLQD